MSSRAERATEPVATLRPMQLWRHIAGCGRQFVLIGDNDHGNGNIIKAVTRALPVLARAGYGHIALEREEEQHGAAYAAFQQATPEQRRKRQDVKALAEHLAYNHNSFIAATAGGIAASVLCEFNPQAAIRATGLTQHLLRLQENFEEYVERTVCPGKSLRYQMLLEQDLGGQGLPPGVTRRELEAARRVYDRWDAQNLRRDGPRMQRLQRAVRQEKAIVFYGSDHFRRSRSEGMDKHLPKNSSVFVMVGEEGLMGGDIATAWKIHRGAVPDFLITTDTRKGYVLPPALRNGLWR